MNPDAKRVCWLLLFVTFFLIVMDVLTQNSNKLIAYNFGVENECNIPTWYSSFLLSAVAFVAFFLSFIEKKRDIHFYFWLFFGIVYSFLSFDESARIHEMINALFAIKWILLYAPFAAAFFLLTAYYLYKIRKNDKRLRNWILGGLIIYAIGGIGLESLDYLFRPLPHGLQILEYLAEEGLEMAGTIIVLTGCLNEYLNRTRNEKV